jgi:hypothetical protein
MHLLKISDQNQERTSGSIALLYEAATAQNGFLEPEKVRKARAKTTRIYLNVVYFYDGISGSLEVVKRDFLMYNGLDKRVSVLLLRVILLLYVVSMLTISATYFRSQ